MVSHQTMWFTRLEVNFLRTACGGVVGGERSEVAVKARAETLHRLGRFSQSVGVVSDLERRPHGVG